MVVQIASATEQISSTSEGINSDIVLIATVSKGNSASSEMTASSASNLFGLSEKLQILMGAFKSSNG